MSDNRETLPVAHVVGERGPEVVAGKRNLAKEAGKAALKALAVAKWLWSIPFIKSMIGTRLTQAGIVGAVALAFADKALGS